MTLREILQIEIWSKRTSRKIFLVFGFLALGFAVFYELDRRWTSPAELRAGKEALIQLDALRGFAGGNDEEYAVRHKIAAQKVDGALHSGLTSRDHAIASSLSLYLESIEFAVLVERTDREYKVRFGNSGNPQIQRTVAMNSGHPQMWKETEDILSRSLHAVLD